MSDPAVRVRGWGEDRLGWVAWLLDLEVGWLLERRIA